MKVLGKFSLSSSLKLVLDIVFIFGCIGIIIWILLSLFLLSNNFGCSTDDKCSSHLTISGVGFQMDYGKNLLRSSEGGTAYFLTGAGKLTIDGPVDWTTAVVLVLEMAIVGVLFLIVVWQLRKLFKTLAQDNPFNDTNIRTLKLIAASIFGMSLFSGLFSLINAFLLNQQYKGEGIVLVSTADFNLTAIFSAAVVFILAEIFRHGSQLEHEKAHTV